MTTERVRPPGAFARVIRRLAVFIILGWVALTLLVTFGVPRLEIVGQQHSVPLAPQNAPAVQAMQRMGRDFKESDSDSFAMLVLEGSSSWAMTRMPTMTSWFVNYATTQSMSSTCRTCGEIASPRRARKARTARPSTCS